MRTTLLKITGLTGILLFVLCAGLAGVANIAVAAEKTVIGELWSRDG